MQCSCMYFLLCSCRFKKNYFDVKNVHRIFYYFYFLAIPAPILTFCVCVCVCFRITNHLCLNTFKNFISFQMCSLSHLQGFHYVEFCFVTLRLKNVI